MNDGNRLESVPRLKNDDYAEEAVELRQTWTKKMTGVELAHMATHSITGRDVSGYIENFIGVALVPVGLAGPLKVKGRHADGVYYIPLAVSAVKRSESKNPTPARKRLTLPTPSCLSSVHWFYTQRKRWFRKNMTGCLGSSCQPMDRPVPGANVPEKPLYYI